MARNPYNRRDLIGHWVTKKQPTGRMCTHACCRGRRVHPENYPVILPDKLLRRASDADLYEGYEKGSDRRQAQILAEMERRDRADIERKARGSERERRRRARAMEHYEEIDRVWLEAEAATNGYMVNKRGQAADISDRYLMTAPERDVRRYATDELKEYFSTHNRPTQAHMRGKDTRLGTLYEEPRRKRRKLSTNPAYYRAGARAAS
jgi:hypothetical protein